MIWYQASNHARPTHYAAVFFSSPVIPGTPKSLTHHHIQTQPPPAPLLNQHLFHHSKPLLTTSKLRILIYTATWSISQQIYTATDQGCSADNEGVLISSPESLPKFNKPTEPSILATLKLKSPVYPCIQ